MNKLIIAALLLTAGCAVAPDPFEQNSPFAADPADLRVYVAWPEGLSHAAPGRLSLTAQRADTGAALASEAALEPVPAGDLTVYRVAEADLRRMRRMVADVAAWESEAPTATEGAFRVMLGACRVGSGPAPDATLSLWMSVAPSQSPTALAINTPLSNADGVFQDQGMCP